MNSQVSVPAAPLPTEASTAAAKQEAGASSPSFLCGKDFSSQCQQNPSLAAGAEKRACRSSSDAASTTSGDGAREDELVSGSDGAESSSEALLQFFGVGEMVEQLQQCEAAAEAARAVGEQLLTQGLLNAAGFPLQPQLSHWKAQLERLHSTPPLTLSRGSSQWVAQSQRRPACSQPKPASSPSPPSTSVPSVESLAALLLAACESLAKPGALKMSAAELQVEIERLECLTKALDEAQKRAVAAPQPSLQQMEALLAMLSEEEVLFLLSQSGLLLHPPSAGPSASGNSSVQKSAVSSRPVSSRLCGSVLERRVRSGSASGIDVSAERGPSDFEGVVAALRREDTSAAWRERLRLGRPGRALRRLDAFKREAEDVFKGQQNSTVMAILSSVDSAIRGVRGVTLQPEELDRRILTLIARVLPLKGEDAKAVEAMLDMEAVLQAREDFLSRPRRGNFLDLISLAKMCKHIPGVCFDKWNLGWIATWRVRRRPVHKHFSAKKYGFFRARQFAICYRSRMTDSPAGDGVFPSEVIIDGEVFKAPPGFEEEVEENVSAAERATPTPPSDCSAEQSTAVVISTASVPSADSSLGVGPSDQQLAVASASPAKRPRPVALASSGLMPLRQQSSAWNAATSLNNNNNASAAEAAASRDVWADLVAQTPRVERVSFDFTNQSWVAQWKQHGRTTYRRFAVSKYGFFKAHQLAVEFKNKFFRENGQTLVSATSSPCGEMAKPTDRGVSATDFCATPLEKAASLDDGLCEDGGKGECGDAAAEGEGQGHVSAASPPEEEDNRPYKTRRLYARRGEFIPRRRTQQLRRVEKESSLSVGDKGCGLHQQSTPAAVPSAEAAAALSSFEAGAAAASSFVSEKTIRGACVGGESARGASASASSSLEEALVGEGEEGGLSQLKSLLLSVLGQVAAAGVKGGFSGEEGRRLQSLATTIRDATHPAALLPFLRVFKDSLAGAASPTEPHDGLLQRLLDLQ